MKTIDQITYTGLFSANGKNSTPPMSISETELFLKLTMGEMSKGKGKPQPGSPEANLREGLLREPIPKIISSRITWAGLPWDEVVSFSVLAFISCLDVMENPGQCVLWAYTLLYMRASEGEVIDMNLLSQWFPNGFPSEERYSEAWDQQKGYELKIDNCDNFLDRKEWWNDLVAIIGKAAPAAVDTSDVVEVDSEDEIHAQSHEA